MVRCLFYLIVFLLVVSAINASAESVKDLSEPITSEKTVEPKLSEPPCLNAEYTHIKFRSETENQLPFPPGAFVELKNCDESVLPDTTEAIEKNLAEEAIQKQEAVKKLSLVLSFLYHQQNSLVGSYEETDQAYQELLRKNLPNLKGYGQTVSNYEDALKNYGEYEAYLSVLPQAVSNYEKKIGSSFNGFVSQRADGAIHLAKSPNLADLSIALQDLQAQGDESTHSQEVPEERGEENEKSSKQGMCAMMGAVAGAGAAENIVLATLTNPVGVLLGVSLGATLCSKTVYTKIAGLQKQLGEELVEMGSYIKSGLSDIGDGLYRWGKEHLYQTPSHASATIAEHYENTRSWLNKKLGWQ